MPYNDSEGVALPAKLFSAIAHDISRVTPAFFRQVRRNLTPADTNDGKILIGMDSVQYCAYQQVTSDYPRVEGPVMHTIRKTLESEAVILELANAIIGERDCQLLYVVLGVAFSTDFSVSEDGLREVIKACYKAFFADGEPKNKIYPIHNLPTLKIYDNSNNTNLNLELYGYLKSIGFKDPVPPLDSMYTNTYGTWRTSRFTIDEVGGDIGSYFASAFMLDEMQAEFVGVSLWELHRLMGTNLTQYSAAAASNFSLGILCPAPKAEELAEFGTEVKANSDCSEAAWGKPVREGHFLEVRKRYGVAMRPVARFIADFLKEEQRNVKRSHYQLTTASWTYRSRSSSVRCWQFTSPLAMAIRNGRLVPINDFGTASNANSASNATRPSQQNSALSFTTTGNNLRQVQNGQSSHRQRQPQYKPSLRGRFKFPEVNVLPQENRQSLFSSSAPSSSRPASPIGPARVSKRNRLLSVSQGPSLIERLESSGEFSFRIPETNGPGGAVSSQHREGGVNRQEGVNAGRNQKARSGHGPELSTAGMASQVKSPVQRGGLYLDDIQDRNGHRHRGGTRRKAAAVHADARDDYEERLREAKRARGNNIAEGSGHGREAYKTVLDYGSPSKPQAKGRSEPDDGLPASTRGLSLQRQSKTPISGSPSTPLSRRINVAESSMALNNHSSISSVSQQRDTATSSRSGVKKAGDRNAKKEPKSSIGRDEDRGQVLNEVGFEKAGRHTEKDARVGNRERDRDWSVGQENRGVASPTNGMRRFVKRTLGVDLLPASGVEDSKSQQDRDRQALPPPRVTPSSPKKNSSVNNSVASSMSFPLLPHSSRAPSSSPLRKNVRHPARDSQISTMTLQSSQSRRRHHDKDSVTSSPNKEMSEMEGIQTAGRNVQRDRELNSTRTTSTVADVVGARTTNDKREGISQYLRLGSDSPASGALSGCPNGSNMSISNTSLSDGSLSRNPSPRAGRRHRRNSSMDISPSPSSSLPARSVSSPPSSRKRSPLSQACEDVNSGSSADEHLARSSSLRSLPQDSPNGSGYLSDGEIDEFWDQDWTDDMVRAGGTTGGRTGKGIGHSRSRSAEYNHMDRNRGPRQNGDSAVEYGGLLASPIIKESSDKRKIGYSTANTSSMTPPHPLSHPHPQVSPRSGIPPTRPNSAVIHDPRLSSIQQYRRGTDLKMEKMEDGGAHGNKSDVLDSNDQPKHQDSHKVLRGVSDQRVEHEHHHSDKKVNMKSQSPLQSVQCSMEHTSKSHRQPPIGPRAMISPPHTPSSNPVPLAHAITPISAQSRRLPPSGPRATSNHSHSRSVTSYSIASDLHASPQPRAQPPIAPRAMLRRL